MTDDIANLTGHEPHPTIPLLSEAELRSLPSDAVQEYYAARRELLIAARTDPIRYGVTLPIWEKADATMRAFREKYPVGVALELDLGGNRASKTERAARKVVELMLSKDNVNVWCCQSTEVSSRQNQQSLIWKYLPLELRRPSGKLRQGSRTKVVYSQAGGFTENTFVLPNGSQCWFKFYAMAVTSLEGAELDLAWPDELVTPDWLEALRYRLVTRNGLMHVTFTPIEGYSATVKMLLESAITIEETPAELLPVRMFKDLSGGVESRHAASPCTHGDLAKDELTASAHSLVNTNNASGSSAPPAQNAYADISGGSLNVKRQAPDGSDAARVDERFDSPPTRKFEMVPRVQEINNPPWKGRVLYFHTADNPFGGYESMKATLEGASRETILMRAYGVPTRSAFGQFNFKDAVHVITHQQYLEIAAASPEGPRYHLVDPCSGRNWFMLWLFYPRPGMAIAYREWPSHGGLWAYIQGIGDPGPWTVPGNADDGAKGPAQTPFKFGLDRYKEEILEAERGEVIWERWMDSRYGNAAVTQREETTTLIEQMADLEMDFRAMTGEKNILTANDGSIDMINSALAYDHDVPLGEYSAKLARVNEPQLLVTKQCPNLIYALQNWTGIDGQRGACKDPIDCLRGAYLSGLDYVDGAMLRPKQPWLAANMR